MTKKKRGKKKAKVYHSTVWDHLPLEERLHREQKVRERYARSSTLVYRKPGTVSGGLPSLGKRK